MIMETERIQYSIRDSKLSFLEEDCVKLFGAKAGKEIFARAENRYNELCGNADFKGMMLRGTMEVLTDAESKEMIWREGDEQYYPEGVTDPNYCVLKFTAIDGRFYSDFYPRSFVL